VSARHLYVTHPQVTIDPSVPVPRWGLSALGRARAEIMTTRAFIRGLTRIVASEETKAIETAEILARALGLPVEVRPDLHENDRTATGFLPPPEFEATADLFFAHPLDSVRGWERAADAQARIVGAVTTIAAERPEASTAFVGHGGVGTLLFCHLKGMPISRRHDQPPGGGGWYGFTLAPPAVDGPWRAIDGENGS
jgi:broad specificity phosphatase PhoE